MSRPELRTTEIDGQIRHIDPPPLLVRLLILTLVLASIWIVWSGMFKPLLLGFGVISIALAVWLAHRMQLDDAGVFALDMLPRVLGFWAWLLLEILKANMQVARVVLSPRMKIAPVVVELRPELPGLVGQATLANCITLTPGTLTFDAESGVFRIHCLTRAGAEDILAGEMVRRVSRVFGDR